MNLQEMQGNEHGNSEAVLSPGFSSSQPQIPLSKTLRVEKYVKSLSAVGRFLHQQGFLQIVVGELLSNLWVAPTMAEHKLNNFH
jgi:hypothetical protein